MQARYWAFLFENLRRAVDDLYTSCEADGHIPGTKEVILVLENYVRDFRYGYYSIWIGLHWFPLKFHLFVVKQFSEYFCG